MPTFNGQDCVVALLLAVCAVTLFSLFVHRNTFKSFLLTTSSRSKAVSTPLVVGLVIAHPDDETMFFLPTIMHLTQPMASGRDVQVKLLCLSSGNADGLGKVRSKELQHVVERLGLSGLTLVDDETHLADGMRTKWPASIVQQHVDEFVRKQNVEVLLTFDADGVSSHPNHIAVFKGVKSFILSQPDDAPVTAYSLLSTSILRKYIALFDLHFSRFESFSSRPPSPEAIHTILSPSWRMSYECMSLHASQFVWYRHLFVIFSRYSCINTVQRLL